MRRFAAYRFMRLVVLQFAAWLATLHHLPVDRFFEDNGWCCDFHRRWSEPAEWESEYPPL
jgi:hypothetical protein